MVLHTLVKVVFLLLASLTAAGSRVQLVADATEEAAFGLLARAGCLLVLAGVLVVVVVVVAAAHCVLDEIQCR